MLDKYTQHFVNLFLILSQEYKPPSCYDIPEDMRTTLCTTNRLEGTLGSKATGEPAMLMGCSVAFALRNAIKAAREEFGLGGDDGIPGWVKLCKIIVLSRITISAVNFLCLQNYHMNRIFSCPIYSGKDSTGNKNQFGSTYILIR